MLFRSLVIIGVHAPEFEFEKNPDNVKKALAKHNIKYPVALDNKLGTWTNFKNRYWPAHYLINKEGQVVYRHFGEGEYDRTEHNIRYLLGIDGKADANLTPQSPSVPGQTPETYVGYSRGANYVGTAWVKDADTNYVLPNALSVNQWSLGGAWTVGAQKITSANAGATLQLNFQAKKLFLVLGTATGKPVHANIRLNGAEITDAAGKDVADHKVTVDQNTLYELVNQKGFQKGLFTLEATEPGLEAYAFTFGN